MANKKFSEFTLKTDPANVDFLVGYDGTDNVRIDPSNLGGGNPAGSDTQLQYNNGGTFGAIPGFTYNDTNDRLIIDTTRVVFGDASGTSFQNGLTIWDDVEFRGNKFEFNDGSATNPSITFFNTGDTNTGIFRPGSDIIAFATGGQEEFRIGANGEIGLSGANFGTAGQVLTSNGSGSGASWTTVSGGASDLNGLSDVLIQSSNSNAYFIDIPTDTTGGGSGFYANNLFIGNNTGQSITTTGKNTLIGNNQFTGLTTGNQNVGLGYGAGQYCGSASQYNVFIGEAGHSSNYATGGTPKSNVAIGHQAAGYGRGFEFSVFIGRQSGFYASSSDFNVAIGYNSLSGGFNVGSATQKTRNVCIGTNSGRSITQGNDNTIIGHDAGIVLSTGSNNTLIGSNSAVSSNSVSNEITLGDSNVTSLRCAVTSITSLSDERDKSEIKDLEYGLAFIDALQPREFVWDNRPEITKTPIRDEEENIVTDEDGNVTYEETEFYSANKGKKDFGFIAQEVRELDNDTLRLVYAENEDKLEMSYGKLVPILVKAIQELKAEVELLKG